MGQIRVLRLIEYIYDDVETFAADSARWTTFSGPDWQGGRMRMRSTALPLEVLEEGSAVMFIPDSDVEL